MKPPLTRARQTSDIEFSMDIVESMAGSIIQHGARSDRIYLMRLGSEPVDDLLNALDKLAAEHNYGKIIAKIPESKLRPFIAAGYGVEARIPGFFAGTQDGYFLAKFRDETRKYTAELAELAGLGAFVKSGVRKN